MNPDHISDVHWNLADTYHTPSIGHVDTQNTVVSVCNLMFYLLQDLNYLERQAFNRFSCLHQVLKKIFVPVTFIYLRSVSENIMPNNIVYNYF